MKTISNRIAPVFAIAALLSPLAAQEPVDQTASQTETTTATTTTNGFPTVTPASGTISHVIHDSVTFSILNKAIEAAGLNDVLDGKNQNTLFAPTDEAFMKLPKGTLDRLMLPENKEKLRALLTYHIIAGQFPSTSLHDGEMKTMSGDKVKIEISGKEFKVNDAKVVTRDLITANGVIHVVDKVIMDKKLDVVKIDK